MLGSGFIIFWIFLLVFSEFSCPGQVWTEFWSKIFFSLFWPTSSHFVQKKMLGSGFIIFWIFLLFFSEFSCPGRVSTEFWSKIFFQFFGLARPFLAKNNARKRFYNFLNFFSEFYYPGRVWTEFWSKILFLLFRPISSCFD